MLERKKNSLEKTTKLLLVSVHTLSIRSVLVCILINMSHCTVKSKIKMPMEITACTAHWNGSIFNYTLHWRVPEFIAYGSGIFNEFLVHANLQFEGKILSLFSNDLIQKQPDQTLYEYTWINFEPQAPEKIYKFGVSCKCGFMCVL